MDSRLAKQVSTAVLPYALRQAQDTLLQLATLAGQGDQLYLRSAANYGVHLLQKR